MPSSLDTPAKESFALVTFQYGDPSAPTYARYTNSAENVGIGPDDYTSVPGMKLTIPKITGTFKEKNAKIQLPKDNFLTEISRGVSQTPIFCWIKERTLAVGGHAGSDLLLFTGRVSRSTRNPRGRSGSVQLEVMNWKSLLDVDINQGIILPTCLWSLFGPICSNGLDINDFRETATIDAVDGKELTVSDVLISSQPDKYWHRGSVTVDGLEISIREFVSSDPTKIHLIRDAPASWASASADFLPGCDLLHRTCIDKYDNEENFQAPGFAVPAYLPVFETGRSG